MMTEEEATAEATRLNSEVAQSRKSSDANAFYIEVERSPGRWEVERRQPKMKLWERLLDAFTW